jgi:tetratricopeptide (TPR) repeat protein
MIRLTTLGPTELRREPGEDILPILVQPKRLALLVYLAVEASNRFVRRDTILALFWPELDQAQARQSLRSALYFLRQHLGEQALTSRGAEEIGVAGDVVVADVVEYRAAAARGDAVRARALYRAPFLTGFHLPDGSVEFDQWLSAVRAQVERTADRLGRESAPRPATDAGIREGAVAAAPPAPAAPAAPAPRSKLRPATIITGLALLVAGVGATSMLVDRRTPAPASGVEGPIATAALTNETGDTALAIWGRYAGDWITEGLQAAGRLPVVPWPSALRASRRADSAARTARADPVQVMHRETGAATIITGSYYRVNDSIRFRADISLARTGRLLWSVPAIAAGPDSIEAAIRELRERILGGIGLSTTPRFAGSSRIDRRPPRFDAFVAYERAMSHYDRSAYGDAVIELERALALDSSFAAPAIAALGAYWNMSRWDRVDSMIRVLDRRRAMLTEPQELEVRFFEARRRGDGRTSLEVRRRAALISPHTAASYNLALLALQMNRPAEALAALEPLRTNESYVDRWAPFWIYLAHSYHLQGRYRDALGAVAELRRRFPDRTVGLALDVASRAALGEVDEIDSVFAADNTPARTYWSTGAALVIAGQELAAHGAADRAGPYFERAAAWLTEQLNADSTNNDYREWLAITYYQLGRLEDARGLAERLARELPDRPAYRRFQALVAARGGDTALAREKLGELSPTEAGAYFAARARMAAIAGDVDRAAALLGEALDRGVPTFHWAHSDWWIDFAPIARDARIRRILVINGGGR